MNARTLARVRLPAAMAVVIVVATLHAAHGQARSMDQEYRPDELTASDQNLRQMQQQQPLLFEQILKDVNSDPRARDPASVDDLAGASPALEDMQRSSPEALLGLFLLLKGAAKSDGKGDR